MKALPNPESVQPRLEPYGAAVVTAYESLYREWTTAHLEVLTNAILVALADLEELELRDDLNLQRDLEMDSIGLAEAAFLIEDLFGVRLDNATLQEIETVGDLRGAMGTHVWAERADRGTVEA